MVCLVCKRNSKREISERGFRREKYDRFDELFGMREK